ncbi:UvrD-helicase domain-containing protein [Candidatus Woesebacteria bacterium]|nr:UvrD-helicase domain-containing protein [Candidatus Woesebacteria bacterium]
MSSVSNLLEKLNPEQQLAVIHKSGPAVVLAGAGSGKTTVLTTRVAWLIAEQNVSPFAILVVTFTNKAAKEIKERILLATGMHIPWNGTFHSLCAKILRIDGQSVGLGPNFVIYDSQDQLSLLKTIYEQNNFDKDEFNIKAVQAAISNAKNELLNPEQYGDVASGTFQKHVAKVYKIYQYELNKAGAVDFDDLLSKTLQLLQTDQIIREKYQRKFEHVLVDEYQDTNKAQYKLTKILATPQNNLFVVGDFCQSIYAWRGADYKNMMQLKQNFPEIQEYRLEQNYRSNQNILDAATQVISLNKTHPILKLWTTKPRGNTITNFEADNNYSEAKKVVQYIRQHSADIDLGEIAILYRTNAQSRAFEEALMQAGIPYKLIGGTKFYERKEVKDVISYLRYAINDFDLVSYQRISKLGKRRFEKFHAWSKQYKPEELATQNPAALLKDILEVTDYLEKFKRETEENLDRAANVEELLAVAVQFETAAQFLENIALIQDNEFADTDVAVDSKRSVNLMSLHSAKGLEFEVVFLVGMEEGLLPHSRSLLDAEQMEEERRLCYVGITRAKSKLYLTYCRSRAQYGVPAETVASRFLFDIDETIVTQETEKKHYSHSNSYGKQNYSYYDKKQKKPDEQKSTRRIIVDDDILDGVINGDFDIDKLINS